MITYRNDGVGELIMNLWLNELIQALLTSFKNPILYWAIFLSLYTLRKYQKHHMTMFKNVKQHTFTAWRNTTVISILGGLFITSISIYFGLIMTYEVIVVISTITIILSIGYHLR